MFKTTSRWEAQTSDLETAICERPLRHRILAGLLALLFTLSGCGEAFDAGPGGGPADASAQVHRDQNTLDAGRVLARPTGKYYFMDYDTIPIDVCKVGRRFRLHDRGFTSSTAAERMVLRQKLAEGRAFSPDELRRLNRLLLVGPGSPIYHFSKALREKGIRVDIPLLDHSARFDASLDGSGIYTIAASIPGSRVAGDRGLNQGECKAVQVGFADIAHHGGRRLLDIQDELKKYSPKVRGFVRGLAAASIGGAVALSVSWGLSATVPDRYNHAAINTNALCLGAATTAALVLEWSGKTGDEELVAQVITAGIVACVSANVALLGRNKIMARRAARAALRVVSSSLQGDAGGLTGSPDLELGQGTVDRISNLVSRSMSRAADQLEVMSAP